MQTAGVIGSGSGGIAFINGSSGQSMIEAGPFNGDMVLGGNSGIASQFFINHNDVGVAVKSTGFIGFSSTTTVTAASDTMLKRAAAGIVKFNTTGGTAGGGFATPAVAKTIATGAITITGSYCVVDTEAAAASDDLDTITGGQDGQWLVLSAANSSRDVVVKDGTGNIQCAGDCTLDNIQDTITLIYNATQTAWLELCRSNNGA